VSAADLAEDAAFHDDVFPWCGVCADFHRPGAHTPVLNDARRAEQRRRNAWRYARMMHTEIITHELHPRRWVVTCAGPDCVWRAELADSPRAFDAALDTHRSHQIAAAAALVAALT